MTTFTWALELATTGITVNTVAPGPTETELFRANNAPGSEGEKRYLSGVPALSQKITISLSKPHSEFAIHHRG